MFVLLWVLDETTDSRFRAVLVRFFYQDRSHIGDHIGNAVHWSQKWQGSRSSHVWKWQEHFCDVWRWFHVFFFLLVEFWILKNFCLSCCFQSPGIYRDHELYLNCSPWKAWVCWACSWCQTGGSVTFSLSAPGFVRLELNLSFVKHEIRCLILNEHVWSRTISDGCFADVATRT